jgi:hypothetical protein
MSAAFDPRRRELAQLRRAIDYYCGVVARTRSRERIEQAHLIIRLREHQLRQMRAAATRRDSRDA